MKGKVWRSRYFKKIFQTVYITTVALLTVALFAMYAYYKQTTVQYLSTVMSRFIGNAYTSIQYQIDLSEKNALNAYLSSDGITLMSSAHSDASVELEAMRSIDYFLSQDPLIHSVYFYNCYSNIIYMFGSDLISNNLNDFFDEEIAEKIARGDGTERMFLPRSVRDSSYQTSTSEVLTIFLKMTNGNTVVINLRTADVFGVLQNDPGVYSKAFNNYIVYSNRDTPIYSSYYHDTLSPFGDDIMYVLNANEWNETVSAPIGNETFYFNVFDDSDANIQIVTITRQADISASFLSYLLFFLVIVGACIALGLFVYYRVSTHLYSPIAKFRKMFSDESTDTSEDEIEFIASHIARTTDKLENLLEYREKSLSLAQATLIKRQLLYNQYSDEAFWQCCEEQELPYRPGNSFILILAHWLPASEPSVHGAEDHRLLCYALGNVLHELFDEPRDIQDIPFEQSEIAFFCCFDSPTNCGLNSSVIQKIRTTFLQYFGLSLSFFISGMLSQPHEMSSAFQELQALSRYEFFYENGCVLYLETAKTDELNTEICPAPDTTALENAIRASDTDACQELLDIFFTELKQYTRSAADASIIVFASKIITVLKRIEATCASFPAFPYHDFYSTICELRTLSLVRRFVSGQLLAVMEAIQAGNGNTSGLLVEEVQQHIQKNYQDFNLSSKSIAQLFHVSSPYLNRVFKQKTGETPASYIKKLRLEHARALLTDTALSVETVARKVGLENTKYFYSMFKNEYGVSPNTYRTNHAKQQLDSNADGGNSAP